MASHTPALPEKTNGEQTPEEARQAALLEEEAKAVERAVEKVLEEKITTDDMKYPGAKIVLTGEMADFCCQFLGKDV